MNQITKDDFISTVESLQLQVSKDINASNAISQVFATDSVYDNSLLVKAIIKLLQIHFPKDENGFCEIEHYCFDMNFGRIQGQDLITPEDLWDRLTEIKISWNNIEKYDSEKSNRYLNDEVGQWSASITEGCLWEQQPIIPSTHPLIDDDNPNPDGV